MINRALLTILAFAGLVGVVGCAVPEPIDNNIVQRYQDSMVRKGPQNRLDDRKTGLLMPPVNPTLPPLAMTKDESGRTLVSLSLDQTVMRALANNLDIRVVGFDPAISREEITKAIAEFDPILVGAANFDEQENNVNSRFGGGQVGTKQFTVGVKDKTITGATWSLAWTMTRKVDNSQFTELFNKSYEQQATFQLDQPLLRNAWPDFNLAKMHIAQVNYKISMAQFRQKVEETMTDVISTYWTLVQNRREVQIQEALLAQTKETSKRVELRKDLDATEVQIKQAEAAVAQRTAVLIRARKTILDTQEKLARLLLDPQINLLDNYEILPTSEPVTALVEYNVVDQLMLSLGHNPILEQARLAIDSAWINVKVAQNQELPKIDLVGSFGLQSLTPEQDRSFVQLYDANYASYSYGVQAEYPIANRAAIADTAAKRFAYQKSIAQMQQVADQVAVLVKTDIRQVRTTHDEMEAQLVAVAAARAQLKALEETEKIRGRLNPEFLQLKLQSQESLADAERAYVLAVANYNQALVDLGRATGTVLEIHNIHIALPAVADDKPWPTELNQPPSPATSPMWPPPITLPVPSGAAPAPSAPANGQ